MVSQFVVDIVVLIRSGRHYHHNSRQHYTHTQTDRDKHRSRGRVRWALNRVTLTELHEEEDGEDKGEFLRLQGLEQSRAQQREGSHEEQVVEDG